MLCLNLRSSDPFFNLALEEYLLKQKREEYLLLYVNSPSVIIGKHQSAHRETNTEFITANNIPVIRRISGGGAVYHDFGNVNFTFIAQSTTGRQVDFRKYTAPVTDFLASVGIDARFEGKNDLKVNGLKISGNAEHVFRERVLHHGTILFDADMGFLKRSLRDDLSCYSTRAVGSNRSPVMNLKEHVVAIKNCEEFRERMMSWFLKFPGNILYDIDQEMTLRAEALAGSKFRTWEWNYAYGPEYHFNNIININGIQHSVALFVKDGIISECKIEGSAVMAEAAKRMTGYRHMVENITGFFANENILITGKEILKFF